jgi:hypothetical protein
MLDLTSTPHTRSEDNPHAGANTTAGQRVDMPPAAIPLSPVPADADVSPPRPASRAAVAPSSTVGVVAASSARSSSSSSSSSSSPGAARDEVQFWMMVEKIAHGLKLETDSGRVARLGSASLSVTEHISATLHLLIHLFFDATALETRIQACEQSGGEDRQRRERQWREVGQVVSAWGAPPLGGGSDRVSVAARPGGGEAAALDAALLAKVAWMSAATNGVDGDPPSVRHSP